MARAVRVRDGAEGFEPPLFLRAKLVREPLGGRAPLWIDEQRGRDRLEDVLREVGAARLEPGRPALDPPRGLGEVAAPERVLPRKRLPEQDAEAPDVGGLGRRQPLEALR